MAYAGWCATGWRRIDGRETGPPVSGTGTFGRLAIAGPDHQNNAYSSPQRNKEERREVMTMRVTLRATLALLWTLVLPQAGAGEPIRIALLKFGTVNWEIDVVRHHKLDKKNGIRLDITELASTQATTLALQAGSTDMIVTDWIWVSRQRGTGADSPCCPIPRRWVLSWSPRQHGSDARRPQGQAARRSGRPARQKLADAARLRDEDAGLRSSGRGRAGLRRPAAARREAAPG